MTPWPTWDKNPRIVGSLWKPSEKFKFFQNVVPSRPAALDWWQDGVMAAAACCWVPGDCEPATHSGELCSAVLPSSRPVGSSACSFPTAAEPGARTALHCNALHCTALHCTALQCTALHCTALHCTLMHCTALYCTLLRWVLFADELRLVSLQQAVWLMTRGQLARRRLGCS